MGRISPALLSTTLDTEAYLEAGREISVLLRRIATFVVHFITGRIISIHALIGHYHGKSSLTGRQILFEQTGINISGAHVIDVVGK